MRGARGTQAYFRIGLDSDNNGLKRKALEPAPSHVEPRVD